MIGKAIPLNAPFLGERESAAVREILASGWLQGGGPCLERVEKALRERFGVRYALVMTSCTHAMEAALMLQDLSPEHEVIIPAYTHPGTGTCVIRQHARVVYADSLPDGPHMDPEDVARRITPNTRAVIAVHYAGIPSGMEELQRLCREHGLTLIEDAAQAFDSRYRGKLAGTLGDGGCISFHNTKNVVCGEGGVLLTDDPDRGRRAVMIREMGTDRALFRAGEVRRYTWRDLGSSFIPSELLMAILEVQLTKADEILRRRRRVFDRYVELFADLERAGRLVLPIVPPEVADNAHLFYVLFENRELRDACQQYLKEQGIGSATHFEPLDTSPFGSRYASSGISGLPQAQRIAATLLRLPIHPALGEEDQDRVVEALTTFFRDR